MSRVLTGMVGIDGPRPTNSSASSIVSAPDDKDRSLKPNVGALGRMLKFQARANKRLDEEGDNKTEGIIQSRSAIKRRQRGLVLMNRICTNYGICAIALPFLTQQAPDAASTTASTDRLARLAASVTSSGDGAGRLTVVEWSALGEAPTTSKADSSHGASPAPSAAATHPFTCLLLPDASIPHTTESGGGEGEGDTSSGKGDAATGKGESAAVSGTKRVRASDRGDRFAAQPTAFHRALSAAVTTLTAQKQKQGSESKRMRVDTPDASVPVPVPADAPPVTSSAAALRRARETHTTKDPTAAATPILTSTTAARKTLHIEAKASGCSDDVPAAAHAPAITSSTGNKRSVFRAAVSTLAAPLSIPLAPPTAAITSATGAARSNTGGSGSSTSRVVRIVK